MEPISFASFTLASILASLPANGEVVTKPTITTHISPAIAGQWEIELDSSITMTKDAQARQAARKERLASANSEPKIKEGAAGGILTQSEERILQTEPNTDQNLQ